MAKIPQGILGGLRGRVGNIVGAAWKGINYIRSMPLSVANPNTTAQQAQRGAFTQTVLTARLLLSDLIATYWDPFARLMSGYNHFISVNISAFNTAGLQTPSLFASGRGILTGLEDLGVVSSASISNHSFTWADNSGTGDALGTDEARLLIFNATQNYWIFKGTPGFGARAGLADNIPDPDFLPGDSIECYAFFTRPDISKISDSTHFPVTAIA